MGAYKRREAVFLLEDGRILPETVSHVFKGAFQGSKCIGGKNAIYSRNRIPISVFSLQHKERSNGNCGKIKKAGSARPYRLHGRKRQRLYPCVKELIIKKACINAGFLFFVEKT